MAPRSSVRAAFGTGPQSPLRGKHGKGDKRGVGIGVGSRLGQRMTPSDRNYKPEPTLEAFAHKVVRPRLAKTGGIRPERALVWRHLRTA